MNKMKVQIIAGVGVGKSSVAELLRAEMAKRGITVNVLNEDVERVPGIGEAMNEQRLKTMAGKVEVSIEMVQVKRV